jgi:hypothetical protein
MQPRRETVVPAPIGTTVNTYPGAAIEAQLEEKVSDLTRVRDELIADLQKKTIPIETQPMQPARAVRVVPAIPAAGKVKKIKKRLKDI